MFIENVDIFAYLHQSKPTAGYRNWEISHNIHPLRTNFKKMITRSDEIPYKNSIRNITREDLALAMDLFDAHVASKGKIPFEIKVKYLSKYGSSIYMLIKAAVSRWNENGEALSMKGCNMDITNFVARKNELFLQNEKYDLVLESINAGVWERNLVTGSEWWSDKFYELLGYKPGEIKASFYNFQNYLLHPDDVKKVEQAIAADLAKNQPHLLEVRLLHKDGNYYWFETAGSVKHNAEGRPEKMVGSIINRHKKVTLEAELEDIRYLLNETGKITKAGGWEFRFDGSGSAWTPHVFDIFEISNQTPPSVEESINFFKGASREIISSAFDKLVAFGRPYDLELQMLTAKGNRKWIRTTGKPLLNSEGKSIGAAGMVQDITCQKERELELIRINEMNTEQNKRLNNFAQIVSHNLHSHAGNISSLINLFEISQTAEEKTEVLQHLKKMSGSLNNTIDELHHLVRAQNDVASVKTDVSFESVFKNVLNILRPNTRQANAVIESDFEPCACIRYVPAYLESILLNLISNSLKYHHPQRAPHIMVKTYQKNNSCFLSVSDNGSGIDLERNHDQIFGMYNTFHANPDARGIGLYITRTQVESLGGKIYVCSTPGEGTTFTIQF